MTDSEWTPAVGAITLVVADLEASKSFYSSAFAAPLIFENEDSAVFRFGPTVLNLLHRSSADELFGTLAGRKRGRRAKSRLHRPGARH
ncbi:MAG: hypothetical protein HHJ11_10365 [Phycicoccus sp.]|nr:hypothetical protein [Phycicoccus sp.]NMM35728.1 hypothetical protein [Phycicoccus sp.]